MNRAWKYNFIPRSVLVILAVCFVGSAVPFVQHTHGERGAATGDGDYDLSWHTIDGGGGTSVGGAFSLSGTIGQPDAGSPGMTGGGYTLAGGFWGGAGADDDPSCPIPADLNCDGVVNVSDLLILFDNWGGCADCGDCPADLNGDCVVNVSDLLTLFDNWG